MPRHRLMDFTASKRTAVGASATTPVIVLLFLCLLALALSILPIVSAAAGVPASGTYTTKFPLTENPISEGNNWVNGGTPGLDWHNIRTTPGLAFGTQTGAVGYTDSVATLTGTWSMNQSAQATVKVNSCTDADYEEVELLLHATITAHSYTGYELNFRCSTGAAAYAQIVRINGPLGSFAYLANQNVTGSQYGVRNGDVIMATSAPDSSGCAVLTSYKNGKVMAGPVTDCTFKGGSPGMGFFFQGTAGANSDFGFTSFTASDGSDTSSGVPAPPTNLTAIVH
jgi:hypothetical protein